MPTFVPHWNSKDSMTSLSTILFLSAVLVLVSESTAWPKDNKDKKSDVTCPMWHGIQFNQDTKMLGLRYSFLLPPYIELYTEQGPVMTLQDACWQHPCVDYPHGDIMISLHNLTMAMGNATSINFTLRWPIPQKHKAKHYSSCVIEELHGIYHTRQNVFHVPQRPDMVQTLSQQTTRNGSNEQAAGTINKTETSGRDNCVHSQAPLTIISLAIFVMVWLWS